MSMARVQANHVMTTVPAAATTFTNVGDRTVGGMENVGTATSNTFTMAETIQCIDTYSVPPTPANAPVPPFEGSEVGSVPLISLTNISIPASWTVPATGKSESLSGIGAAPNNTGPGTYTIFPDVQIIIGSAVDVTVAGTGVGVATTTATITGPVTELDDWVVPWTPSDAPPFFDGSDFGLARSSGYGNTAKGGPGIFYITFTLEFSLSEFGTSPAGTPPVDWIGTPVELDFKIGVINNYDNDRERYITAYQDAYSSLTKVPELSEWQT